MISIPLPGYAKQKTPRLAIQDRGGDEPSPRRFKKSYDGMICAHLTFVGALDIPVRFGVDQNEEADKNVRAPAPQGIKCRKKVRCAQP